jgi:hypothetical protein
MSDKRVSLRYLCADLVKVDWMSADGEFHTDSGVLEDICAEGACVELENEIQLGVMMMITLDGKSFYGRVSHCNYRDYGWFVGMRFSQDTPWSSRVVAPKHLTSLRALAESAAEVAS